MAAASIFLATWVNPVEMLALAVWTAVMFTGLEVWESQGVRSKEDTAVEKGLEQDKAT